MDFSVVVVPNDEIQKRRKCVANHSFNWMTILGRNTASEVEFVMDLMELVQRRIFMKKSSKQRHLLDEKRIKVVLLFAQTSETLYTTRT